MKKILKKLVRHHPSTRVDPQRKLIIGNSMTGETEDHSGKLTLKDEELIGFIETMDKRLSSLEHDLWAIQRRIAEIADDEVQDR